MVFSTELAASNKISDNNSKYLEAGIHENVKFTSARVAVSPTGKNYIEFTFEKEGKTLTHTEWEPSANGNTEADQAKVTNQVTRIMRILKCFYPKEALIFAANTYTEFSNWVVSMLNAANKEILLRVKVVYNDKGYTTLPNYVKFACIEPMNIPMGFYEEGKNDSKIREITGIDLFVRPVIADKEDKVVNPLDLVAVTTEEDPNKLPF